MTSSDFQIIATELKKDIITSVGSMFMDLSGKIGSLDLKVVNLDGKVNKLEGRVGSLEGNVKKLGNEVQKLGDEVEKLGDEVRWQGSKVDALSKDVKTALSAQTKILAHESVVKNHEERITFLEK